MDIGSGEILFILLIALLLYGGRLPEVARSIGRSVAALKKGMMESTSEVTRTLDRAMEDPDEAAEEPSRPRTVKRIQPAPAELATEDISGNADAPPATAAAGPEDAAPGDPAKPRG